MRYEGSQFRFAQSIADIVDRYVGENTFVQACCARANVGIRVSARHKVFTDERTGMPQLLEKVYNRYIPPTVLGPSLYYWLKTYRGSYAPWFEEFISHAVSRYGKEWGPYHDQGAKYRHRNLAAEASRSLVADGVLLRERSESVRFFNVPLMELRQDVCYTVYIDMPEDDRREGLYQYIQDTREKHIYIVSEPDRPPLNFYKVWQFDTVSKIDNIFLMSSTQELERWK